VTSDRRFVVPYRWFLAVALGLAVGLAATVQGQGPGTGQPLAKDKAAAGAPTSDMELVERLLVARRDYQTALQKLRDYYIAQSDTERERWAAEELILYHRIPKQAYRLELDVPPPGLKAEVNIPKANDDYRDAMIYKGVGRGWEYVDNQRRAELLLQRILTLYPQSDKIDEAAYQLGDLYEEMGQHRRAALYFERCFQWNFNTQFDARLRAARLYDRQTLDRGRAIDLYKEVITHEVDPKWRQEAQKRLSELKGSR
jgi:tetratricopeptide (TPR) repeat protein